MAHNDRRTPQAKSVGKINYRRISNRKNAPTNDGDGKRPLHTDIV